MTQDNSEYHVENVLRKKKYILWWNQQLEHAAKSRVAKKLRNLEKPRVWHFGLKNLEKNCNFEPFLHVKYKSIDIIWHKKSTVKITNFCSHQFFFSKKKHIKVALQYLFNVFKFLL